MKQRVAVIGAGLGAPAGDALSFNVFVIDLPLAAGASCATRLLANGFVDHVHIFDKARKWKCRRIALVVDMTP